ncbi:DUF4013 domain-containing protein [Methanonatronarchaeum sp. AMET-Sl]|uniref:DUF4013 domain-containing protein n=1 Tax=Methanonatronarchaeum sp. AMET-Sl TaxID=3037654 RepID=UPI00244E323B|nr:DUF4013 domain-containing protein [Methanonatronarchaeum sp. AMET-Sl]WGI16943.1 DUF4013 domain-containing protein [Methanonatronarchaeum sp. AMET-Sl]
MLMEALKYPIKEDKGLINILIGGLLLILSFLLIPAFIVIGYLIKVGAETSKGSDKLIEFGEWINLLVTGFVGWIITIIYSIIPFLIWGLIAFVLIGVLGLGGDSAFVAGIGVLGFIVLWLLGLLIGILIYYTVPAALINYGRESSFKAAFRLSQLKEIWMTREYFTAALLPIFLMIIQYIVITILGFTIIGLILVPFVAFYFHLVIIRIFGIAFRQVVGGTSGL